jgi:ribosomal protein S18 acetylase RimI-like enzyme
VSPLDAPDVSGLDAPDLPRAVDVLAEAFADNPLNRGVIRRRSRSARVRSNAWGLRVQLPLAVRHGNVLAARADAAVAGVLVGSPPFGHPFPPPPLLLRIAAAFGQGLAAAGRWNEVYEALLARRPEAPHWYLSLLGVHPAAQGRGLGGALLGAWLGRVDAAGGDAWLETDAPRSLGLYRAAGFEVREEIALAGVPIWLLERGARRG